MPICAVCSRNRSSYCLAQQYSWCLDCVSRLAHAFLGPLRDNLAPAWADAWPGQPPAASPALPTPADDDGIPLGIVVENADLAVSRGDLERGVASMASAAVAYEQIGDSLTALAVWVRVEELDPEHSNAATRIPVLLDVLLIDRREYETLVSKPDPFLLEVAFALRSDDADLAVALIQEFLPVSPRDVGSDVATAPLVGAHRVLSSVDRGDSPDAETHLALAIAYGEMGLEADALHEAARAQTIAPTDGAGLRAAELLVGSVAYPTLLSSILYRS